MSSSASGLLRTLRPHQWVKNSFVVAPLVFARHLEDPAYILRSGLAFAAFCALSGAVYAFNDVRDIEADRAHPRKRNRPIASGVISERTALIAAAVLAIAGLGLAFALDWRAGACAAVYLGQNLAYSVRLKHVAFVDVTLIATGFLLRVLAAATAVAYVLYTRDAHTVAFFGTDRLVWSAPFPVLGFIRFLMLALWRPRADSPTDAMLRDPLSLAIVVSWAGVVIYILYGQ